jgi:hypothetical protein
MDRAEGPLIRRMSRLNCDKSGTPKVRVMIFSGRKVSASIYHKMDSHGTQIAKGFAKYDDHLRFATAIEPNGSTSAQMSELMTY